MSRRPVRPVHITVSHTPVCSCWRDGFVVHFQGETIGVVLQVKGLRGFGFGMGSPMQPESFSVLNGFLCALCHVARSGCRSVELREI